MLKPPALIFLSLVFFAATPVNVLSQNKTPQADLTVSRILSDDGITGEIKDRIVQHVKSNFLQETVNQIIDGNDGGEKDLILSEINYSAFPENAKFYLLRNRGFEHWSVSYVQHNGNLYTSLKKGDLESFLKAYDFLAKRDALVLFLTAYKHFLADEFAAHSTEVVNQKLLENLRQNVDKKAFAQNFDDPVLTRKSNGATKIIFYSLNTSNYAFSKIQVLVSPDYAFDWKSTVVQKEK